MCGSLTFLSFQLYSKTGSESVVIHCLALLHTCTIILRGLQKFYDFYYHREKKISMRKPDSCIK